ncbi:MAG: terpene cyclase/mutase family protein [Lentisphaerae bacterium]|nr:terpene cyclase/mutase family protein [Lentisphaerota bacterium]
MDEQESAAGTEVRVHHHDLMELFETLSFREKVRRVIHGLRQPPDSGEYKWARLQMIRLSAPVSGVVVPVLGVLLLTILAAVAPSRGRTYKVQIIDPEEAPKLEEIEEIKEKPPEPQDIEFTPDVKFTDNNPSPTPPKDFSPQPAEFDSVAMVKSPVIMRGIYGSRSPGMRGEAMRRYGAPSGVEDAVMRALRWLKKNQNSDGSWNNVKPAMTSMALLAFLAHGETPASVEFGQTVEKAIRWLIDNQTGDGRFNGRDGNDYSQPIAAYALCEAYGLTKVPAIKDAADKAIAVVITGQNPGGGFNYKLIPTPARDDTSYMGWCAQALKAAKMAGLEHAQLDTCMKTAIAGFEKNSVPQGGFGYAGPGRGGLTGAGVLSMQLLGAANKPACTQGLEALADVTFFWDGKAPNRKWNENYYWYYITQAKFHAGGETWKLWNDIFARTLVENQTIIPKAIEGPGGKLWDIGWWDMPRELSGHTDGPVMNTALSCLQLEVYYRYLPTFMTPEIIDAGGEAGIEAIDAGRGAGGGVGKGDVIDIQINI